jgi:multidrug transporter EmrE-like cation transporter
MRTHEAGEVFGPRMTLFADVLSVGLVTSVACLPLVTAPAALSTACAVLRGAGQDRPVTAGRYAALLRERLRAGDLLAGAVALAGVLLLAVDLALAGTGLPGAPLFAVTAAVIGACAAVIGLRACARPESLTDWRAAVRGAARDAVADVGGSGLVLLAVATAVLCAWMLVPLAFLAPGPLALALTGVDVRHGASRGA